LAGRLDEAHERTSQALDLAAALKERGSQASALRILGDIASNAGPPEVETAERYLREALVLAAELGRRPLVAHCHMDLGRLSRSTGKSDAAQGHLATGVSMYREMDMSFWLGRAEAEMRACEPPTTRRKLRRRASHKQRLVN
jgi:sugar phosphate isomerase/epimerase